jgi:hypothetical protein
VTRRGFILRPLVDENHEPTTRKALLIHESGGIWGDWQLNLPEPADLVAEVVRLQERGCEVVLHG